MSTYRSLDRSIGLSKSVLLRFLGSFDSWWLKFEVARVRLGVTVPLISLLEDVQSATVVVLQDFQSPNKFFFEPCWCSFMKSGRNVLRICHWYKLSGHRPHQRQEFCWRSDQGFEVRSRSYQMDDCQQSTWPIRWYTLARHDGYKWRYYLGECKE